MAAAGAARYAAAGGPDGRGSTNANTMPLLDNPVATVDTHPDIQVGASAQRRQERQLRQDHPNELEMRGVLSKRALAVDASGPASRLRSAARAVTSEW